MYLSSLGKETAHVQLQRGLPHESCRCVATQERKCPRGMETKTGPKQEQERVCTKVATTLPSTILAYVVSALI